VIIRVPPLPPSINKTSFPFPLLSKTITGDILDKGRLPGSMKLDGEGGTPAAK